MHKTHTDFGCLFFSCVWSQSQQDGCGSRKCYAIRVNFDILWKCACVWVFAKKNMKGSWLHRKRLNCSRTVNAVRLFDTQNSLKFWNRALYRQCNAFDHGANSKRIQFISVDMDIDLMEIKQCTPQQQQQQQYCTNTFQTKTSFFARHEIHDIVPLKLAHAFSTLTIFRMGTITDQWTLCVCLVVWNLNCNNQTVQHQISESEIERDYNLICVFVSGE